MMIIVMDNSNVFVLMNLSMIISHEIAKWKQNYYLGPPFPSGVRHSIYSSTILMEHVLQCRQF